MKNNKGFVGVGVIIAIIAALIIGGGAVYFATRTSTPSSQNTEENNYELPVNQNNTLNNTTKDNATVSNPIVAPINVTFPTAGITLVEGNTYNITWTNSGNTNVNYNIYLENEQAGDIRIGETSKNSFSWTVPSILSYINGGDKGADVAPTDGYRISFYTIGTSVEKMKQYFSPVFKIIPSDTKADSVEGYITNNQVGLFHINESVPDQITLSQAEYSIRETTIFPEGDLEEQFIVSKNDKELLTFELYPHLNKIGNITVTSSEFKTQERVGVGSTISDFIKAYPNYKFWYSQEEGEHFVLNTSNDQASPQFLLDRSGLINPNENFNSPTHRQAKISDFKMTAKIVNVRVY